MKTSTQKYAILDGLQPLKLLEGILSVEPLNIFLPKSTNAKLMTKRWMFGVLAYYYLK